MAYYVGNQQVSSLDYDKKKKQEQAEAARKRAMDDYKKANTKVTPTVGTAQKQSSSKTNGVSWLPEATITPIQNYPDYGSRPTYTPSSALNNAAAQLAQYENNKPGAYQSKYQDQIAGLLDKILNREKFSYDAMSDPLYRQYKDSYTQQGKLAMQDAMGDAAALTGGYGSSYGQTVGQQVYQQNLQKINDKIPELYNAAYGRYADEGNKMTNDLGILQGLDESDYGRHRDTVSDYYNELQYFYTKYNDMSNQELQRYMNDQDAWESDRAYWYQREQDAQSQSNWQAEFDLAKQKAQSSGSSGSSKINMAQIAPEIENAFKSGDSQSEVYRYLLSLGLSDSQLSQAMQYADTFYGGSSGVQAPAVSAISNGSTKPITPLTEGEFNRSPAMQAQYGTYKKYLLAIGAK